MPIYYVNGTTTTGGCDFSMFVEADKPKQVPAIYSRDVPELYGVYEEELVIKDIFEVPQPSGRMRTLPWSDTEGVWSVKDMAIEPISNFTIVGRAHGDDEATTMVFNGVTNSDALEKFTHALRPHLATLKILREQEQNPDWDGVHIDAVIESSAEMTLT